MAAMGITDEQWEFIKSKNYKKEFELEDVEVFAIYSLGQMNKKVVECDSALLMMTVVAVFTIEEINGVTELDFTNPDDWRDVTIDSITVSLEYPDFEFGGSSKSTFSDLSFINSIALLS